MWEVIIFIFFNNKVILCLLDKKSNFFGTSVVQLAPPYNSIHRILVRNSFIKSRILFSIIFHKSSNQFESILTVWVDIQSQGFMLTSSFFKGKSIFWIKYTDAPVFVLYNEILKMTLYSGRSAEWDYSTLWVMTYVRLEKWINWI